jgi:hypothetical protein
MEDLNEDDLIMYEESQEIKETLWKAWDILNDKEAINKILLDSLLINELEKNKSQILFNIKDNNSLSTTNNTISKDSFEKNSKY